MTGTYEKNILYFNKAISEVETNLSIKIDCIRINQPDYKHLFGEETDYLSQIGNTRLVVAKYVPAGELWVLYISAGIENMILFNLGGSFNAGAY